MKLNLMMAIAGTCAFAFIAKAPILHFTTKETVSGVITAKERVSSGDESRYMIWTKDETFQNTDTIWAWKFDSADVYGKVQIGATCEMTVTGLRVPFLSMNRNILSASCV